MGNSNDIQHHSGDEEEKKVDTFNMFLQYSKSLRKVSETKKKQNEIIENKNIDTVSEKERERTNNTKVRNTSQINKKSDSSKEICFDEKTNKKQPEKKEKSDIDDKNKRIIVRLKNMMTAKISEQLFYSVFFSMFVPAIIVFFIPFLGFDGSVTKKVISYFVVGLFWLFLIYSYVTLLIVKLYSMDKTSELYKKKSRRFIIYRFFGIINFFSNKTATITDIVFILSIVLIILLNAIKVSSTFVMCLSVGLFILSLNMHIYFNDSVYEYNLKSTKKKVKGVNKNE